MGGEPFPPGDFPPLVPSEELPFTGSGRCPGLGRNEGLRPLLIPVVSESSHPLPEEIPEDPDDAEDRAFPQGGSTADGQLQTWL